MSEGELFFTIVFYLTAVGVPFIGSFAIAAIARRLLKFAGVIGWLNSTVAAMVCMGLVYSTVLVNLPWFARTRSGELSMSEAVQLFIYTGITAAICAAGATLGYWWFRKSYADKT